MTRNDPLDHLERKLGRARKRLAELERDLQTFDIDGLGVEETRDDGLPVTATLVLRRPLDPEWEITLGEVVHNVRSSLDQMVTCIVIAAGGSAEQHGGSFLIRRNRTDYARLSPRELKGVPDQAQALIEAIQPFDSSTTGHPLALLTYISQWDKHRDGQPSAVLARDTAVVLMSDRLKLIEVLDLGVSSLPARSLEAGDNLIAALKPAAVAATAERFRDLQQRDAEAQMTYSWVLGVSFGKEHVLAPDVREAVDFVEHQVLGPLTPFIKRPGAGAIVGRI